MKINTAAHTLNSRLAGNGGTIRPPADWGESERDFHRL